MLKQIISLVSRSTLAKEVPWLRKQKKRRMYLSVRAAAKFAALTAVQKRSLNRLKISSLSFKAG